ncbi:hypothetical protein O181_015558 [Austropuccinia psidii MF-1]|uniref:Uncharacterized protein n=1 Tax=Austropuccinia psidii MF-1 TaxID=1389203 RepID=A0A9Q3C3G1_9BASI|nr:hypothetical protein [Austropuccinia psidii MF-1]
MLCADARSVERRATPELQVKEPCAAAWICQLVPIGVLAKNHETNDELETIASSVSAVAVKCAKTSKIEPSWRRPGLTAKKKPWADYGARWACSQALPCPRNHPLLLIKAWCAATNEDWRQQPSYQKNDKKKLAQNERNCGGCHNAPGKMWCQLPAIDFTSSKNQANIEHTSHSGLTPNPVTSTNIGSPVPSTESPHPLNLLQSTEGC